MSDRLSRIAPWGVLAMMTLLFAVGFSWLSVLRHEAFQSHAFDLGNMDQAVWNTLHGRPLRFTDMALPTNRVLTTRLAIHVEPLLFLLAIPYAFHPAPETLLVVQAVVVGTGAIPAYLLARRYVGSPWLSLVFPAAYLLHPSLQNAVLDDFHPVAMAATFLLWALFSLSVGSVWGFGIAAALAAASKEEVGLLVAMIGLVWLWQRRVAPGVVSIVGGVAWFLVSVSVIIHHFNPQGRSPYLERYSYLGSSLEGVLTGAMRHPGLVWSVLSSEPRLLYLNALLDPLGYVSILGLPILLLAAPALAINMLSSDQTMYSGFYQYSAEIVPYTVVAAVAGVAAAARVSRERAVAWKAVPVVLCLLVLVASLAATRRYGFTPLSDGYVVPAVGLHQRLEASMLRRIPPNAVVAAADEVEPHLSDRRTVYLLPTIHPRNGPAAQFLALDASIPSLPFRPDQLHTVVARALQDGYGVTSADDGVLVARKGGHSHVLPTRFYSFAFERGSHVSPVRAAWGPLRLTGFTIHPGYGWVNRSRPSIEVETYWRASRRLPSGVVISFYLSPVYTRIPVPAQSWSVESDSPTTAWLPPPHWPAFRTVRVASLPLLPSTDAAGTVQVAVGVSGLGAARGVQPARRVPGAPRLVRLTTIQVRP